MERFDIVIVGDGTAGCVLADRLSADPSRRVLMLEARGRGQGFLDRHTGRVGRLLTDARFNWRFATVTEENVDGRSIVVPRGRASAARRSSTA